MREEELYEVFSDIHEEHVKEARMQKPKISKLVRAGGILAACLVLILFAGMRLVWQKAPDDSESQLPMLTIGENLSDGMGFEGLMAYDVSELVNANPWREGAELSVLPVFKNPLTYHNNYMTVSGADFDAMEKYLLDIAERLGLDTDNLEVTDNAPTEERRAAILEKYGEVPEGYFDPTEVLTEAEGIEISVDIFMTATITFEPAISVPEEYNFFDHASYGDTAALAEYIKKSYHELLDMDNPQVNIHGGDYDINFSQHYQIEFYDGSGDLADQMINYNFNRVVFYLGNDEGNLWLVRIFQPDLSEKTGDYPIISAEEAKNLLINGNYITTVPYEMPGADYVKKVELVYRTARWEEYYMPYYRFYVELPDEEREGGLKTYGAYYVPAVESQYILDMPLWDGRFN